MKGDMAINYDKNISNNYLLFFNFFFKNFGHILISTNLYKSKRTAINNNKIKLYKLLVTKLYVIPIFPNQLYYL